MSWIPKRQAGAGGRGPVFFLLVAARVAPILLLLGNATAQRAVAEEQTEPPSESAAPPPESDATEAPFVEAPEAEPSAAPEVMDEIRVHGRSPRELLQDVPRSMRVFDALDLEMRTIEDISEISRFTPNLRFDAVAGSSNAARIYIRGVGQDDSIVTADPGVALYLDGVYLGGTVGGIFDLFSVQQVEVLRGPQGFRFGRNAIGGAISVTSQRPSGDYGGQLSARIGNYARKELKGFFEFPILEDELSGRLAFSGRYRKGYAQDHYQGIDLNDERSIGGRSTFTWTPTPDLAVTLYLDQTRATPESVAFQILATDEEHGLIRAAADTPLFDPDVILINQNIPNLPRLGEDFFTQIDGDPFNLQIDNPSQNDLTTGGLALDIEWSFEPLTLRSITSYRDLDAQLGLDIDGTSFAGIGLNTKRDQWQFSQELQLTGSSFDDRLEWRAGLFWFQDDADETGTTDIFATTSQAARALRSSVDLAVADACSRFAFLRCRGVTTLRGVEGGLTFAFVAANFAASGAFAPGTPAQQNAAAREFLMMVNRLPGETVVGQVNHQESYSIGSYLYGTYELSQDLRFSAGVRYTDDHKLLFRNEFLLPSRTPLIHNVKRKESWQDWSPTFNLAWDFMDGGMAYLKASHGYRAGGFNGRSARSGAVLTDEQASLEESDGLLIPYGPERLWNYELGVKTSWFEGRVTVNTSLYYIHYRNMQVRHATLDPETLAFRLLVQTADESVIQGAEIEWLAEPHERVLLDGGIALNHGRYREFDDAIPNPAFDPLDTGSDIPPTLGGGGLHLINLPMFEMNVGAQYTHPFSFGDVAARVDYSFQSRVFYSPNNSDVASQGKYGLLDGRISWRNPDDTLEFAIWGKNLLDRVYLQNASDLLGLIGIAAGQPGAPRMYGLELTYRWP